MALILNVINPRIGGVLISGEKGTAKSTLVRGMADVTGKMKVIDLPLNITEDRLVGSIDIETAILHGKAVFEPGLLKKADGNILYIDEVNLLSDHITNCLLEAAASGINIIEREGISFKHRSEFVLVGTMNPEEGLLRPQILDRFGLYTEVHGERESNSRAEIIRRRLEFEKNPVKYRAKYRAENSELSNRITQASRLLRNIRITNENLMLAANIAWEAGCAGHRAEIVIIETARAVAAYDNRTTVTEDDIHVAAEYALPHRMRETSPAPPPPPPMPEQPEKESKSTQFEEESTESGEKNISQVPPSEIDAGMATEPEQNEHSEPAQDIADDIEEPCGSFDIEIADFRLNEIRKVQGAGKRARVKTDSRQGRYIRYRFPGGKVRDIAFDATLRAAAPFQNFRKNANLAVVIKSSDIREKVKEKHTGCIVLFVVDASGSMGAMKRMGAVKGAVISMLDEAYKKRDRVGVVAFRKQGADTLLGITRSIDLAYQCLRELPTGGKTPMAAGLARGYELLKTAAIKEPDLLPYLVLVSDGKTNVSLEGTNPVDDVLRIACRIRNEGIRSMVIDTEEGYIRLGMAKKISEALNAEYVKLDNVTAQGISSSVKHIIS